MITGFNTDIQFEGTTYHVQTEDKGLKTPLILSLVYVGGTIIASKRTPYGDLVEQGFDEQALTERLQRQHKLICAAIKAGRVADLKKMSGEARPAANGRKGASAPVAEPPPQTDAEAAPESGASISENSSQPAPPVEEAVVAERTLESTQQPRETFAEAKDEIPGNQLDIYEGEVAVIEPVTLTLLEDEGEFRAGQLAMLRLHVGRGGYGDNHIAGAAISIKILGTTFRPLMLSAKTDAKGTATVRALLPRFTSGRAAVIIRATAEGETAELRRIIHHS